MPENQNAARQPESGESRPPEGYGFQWSWTLTLITIYVVVLLIERFQEVHPRSEEFIRNHFALSTQGLAHGYWWQLITYQFMHGGWIHLLLNSWAIFIFGTELEYQLGARRYLTLVFTSGIIGGLLQTLTAIIWPALFVGPVVGASACAFGLVAAFATLFPEHQLKMLVLFVVPVRVRADMMLIALIVAALMGFIFPMGHIANAAHLGGMAMGWYYVKKLLGNYRVPGYLEEASQPPKPANTQK